MTIREFFLSLFIGALLGICVMAYLFTVATTPTADQVANAAMAGKSVVEVGR